MGLLHKAGFVKTEMRETLQAPVTLQHLIMNLVAGGLEGCAVELSGLCSPTLLGCISPSVWQSVSLPRRRQRISAGRLEIPGDTWRYLEILPPPHPHLQKELMGFLGLVGFYCAFCMNSSTAVAALTNLLKA